MFQSWQITIAFLLILPFLLTLLEKFFILKLRGHLGEKKVKRILDLLPKEDYKVFNDILINSENGLTQIDHVLISIYGVFVIETKNMKGKIYGSPVTNEWTKYSSGRKVVFKNPIHQNYGHAKAIQTLLQIDASKIINLVVLAGSAELQFEGGEQVAYIRDLRDFVLSHKTELFTPAQLDELSYMLGEANLKTSKSRHEHMQQKRKKAKEKAEKNDALICPRCNGKLVLRHGKYGEFYGCSNFPQCKYTKNV